MVERHEVVSAYRFLLGREPESEAAIKHHARARDWFALRRTFLASGEYQAQHPAPSAGRYLTGDALEIDMLVSEEQLSRLFAQVQRSWEKLGRETPHFSVLTDPAYLPERLGTHEDEFFASGADAVARLDAALARAGAERPAGACLELGCGVGRITAHLARRFRKVTALDLSPPHLEIAAKRLRAAANVELRQMRSLADGAVAESCELFFSLLVLQHNPPPLMLALLDRAFDALAPGGYAFFQVPVYQPDYRFEVETYLRQTTERASSMEMHMLPQRYLFPLFAKHRLSLLDLVDDGSTGPLYVSQQYLLQKAQW